MSAPETAITVAFETRLKAFPSLPIHPNGVAVNFYPESVAWANVGFTPDLKTPYVKPFLLPAETFQSEIGTAGQNRHTGIFQVSIFAPKGGGAGPINALRDSLVNYFKRGTELVLSTGAILKVEKAYPSPMLTEDLWVHIPITIRYRTDAAN